MTTINPNLFHNFRAERQYTKTETGGQIAFERNLPNGKSVTGTTTITRLEDGGANVSKSRTLPNGVTLSKERTFSAEQVEAFQTRFNNNLIQVDGDGSGATTNNLPTTNIEV
jgi:hypothetical protein